MAPAVPAARAIDSRERGEYIGAEMARLRVPASRSGCCTTARSSMPSSG